MVSNLIGQNLEDKVLIAIKKIMTLSLTATVVMTLLLNLFPVYFLNLFYQTPEFVHDAIPVTRVTSIGMIGMSVGSVWLNAVTGTGKTKVNLLTELTAIIIYIIYIYFIMIKWRLPLAIVWTNEIVYWLVMFSIAFWYIHSGRWKSVNRNVVLSG